MPSTRGKKQDGDKVSHKIEKIVHDWEQDGTIGTSRPKSKKKAVKQAVAIALKQTGKSKYQKKGTHH